MRWAELEDQHQFIPQGPVAGLITIFQSSARKAHCLDDVPASLKRRKRMTESAPVHAVQQPTESKTKLKRMLEKEIPYSNIPPQDKHLYEEAEQKEWKSWLDYRQL